MPYTQRQINRLIGNADSRVLPKSAPLTLSQRVSESEVRRRIYAWEDDTVEIIWKLHKQAVNDIVAASAYLTDERGASGVMWKSLIAGHIDERLRRLYREIAALVSQRSLTAYYAGYLGRAWSLDVSTIESVRVRYNVPLRDEAQAAIADDWLKRTGEDMATKYAIIAGTYSLKARGQLNTTLTQDESPAEGMIRIRRLLLGQPQKRGGAFYEAQVTARFAIIAAGNLGAVRLYSENIATQEAVSPIGTGYLVLTAGDGRVCPVCLEASREIWQIDVPTGLLKGPVPPLHPGCRCAPFFVVLPSDLMPADMPPDTTWQEWLVLAGLDGLLDDFMGEGLQSSQIGDEVTYADF